MDQPTRRLSDAEADRLPARYEADNADPTARLCPHCGARRFWAQSGATGTWGSGHRSVVNLTELATGWRRLLLGAATTALLACVCSVCGYTEFYADDPTEIDPTRRK